MGAANSFGQDVLGQWNGMLDIPGMSLRIVFHLTEEDGAFKENIHFMWLSGGNQPDHHSINRFRSGRLKESLKTIFSQLVLLLHDSGYVSIKQLYTGGTKLEAPNDLKIITKGKAYVSMDDKVFEQDIDRNTLQVNVSVEIKQPGTKMIECWSEDQRADGKPSGAYFVDMVREE